MNNPDQGLPPPYELTANEPPPPYEEVTEEERRPVADAEAPNRTEAAASAATVPTQLHRNSRPTRRSAEHDDDCIPKCKRRGCQHDFDSVGVQPPRSDPFCPSSAPAQSVQQQPWRPFLPTYPPPGGKPFVSAEKGNPVKAQQQQQVQQQAINPNEQQMHRGRVVSLSLPQNVQQNQLNNPPAVDRTLTTNSNQGDDTSSRMGKFGPKGANLYVNNIPRFWNKEDLASKFAFFGFVTSCHVLKKLKTRTNEGAGFVCYGSHEDAENAMRLMHARVVGRGEERKQISVSVKDGEENFCPPRLQHLNEKIKEEIQEAEKFLVPQPNTFPSLCLSIDPPDTHRRPIQAPPPPSFPFPHSQANNPKGFSPSPSRPPTFPPRQPEPQLHPHPEGLRNGGGGRGVPPAPPPPLPAAVCRHTCIMPTHHQHKPQPAPPPHPPATENIPPLASQVGPLLTVQPPQCRSVCPPAPGGKAPQDHMMATPQHQHHHQAVLSKQQQQQEEPAAGWRFNGATRGAGTGTAAGGYRSRGRVPTPISKPELQHEHEHASAEGGGFSSHSPSPTASTVDLTPGTVSQEGHRAADMNGVYTLRGPVDMKTCVTVTCGHGAASFGPFGLSTSPISPAVPSDTSAEMNRHGDDQAEGGREYAEIEKGKGIMVGGCVSSIGCEGERERRGIGPPHSHSHSHSLHLNSIAGFPPPLSTPLQALPPAHSQAVPNLSPSDQERQPGGSDSRDSLDSRGGDLSPQQQMTQGSSVESDAVTSHGPTIDRNVATATDLGTGFAHRHLLRTVSIPPGGGPRVLSRSPSEEAAADSAKVSVFPPPPGFEDHRLAVSAFPATAATAAAAAAASAVQMQMQNRSRLQQSAASLAAAAADCSTRRTGDIGVGKDQQNTNTPPLMVHPNTPPKTTTTHSTDQHLLPLSPLRPRPCLPTDPKRGSPATNSSSGVTPGETLSAEWCASLSSLPPPPPRGEAPGPGQQQPHPHVSPGFF